MELIYFEPCMNLLQNYSVPTNLDNLNHMDA